MQITTKGKSVAILMFFMSFLSFAQTNVWTGAQSTSWNNAANWSLNTLPLLATNVEIPAVTSGNYPLVNGESGLADCHNLSIADGATINVTGYGNLRISGAISGNGKINAVNGGTVVMIGTLPQVLNASVFTNNTVSSLTTYNALGVTLVGNLDLTGVLTLQSGVFNTGGGLTLKSNAVTTAQVAESAGAVTGNVTVERFIPARRAFRLISPSTTGGTISSNWQEGAPATNPVGFGTDITGPGGAANGFDVSGSNNPSLFTHNNLTSTWEAVASTSGTLNAGAAYRLLVRGDRTVDQASNSAVPTATTLRTTGALTTGTVWATNLSPVAGGFSLVGNPYQSVINMEQLLNDSGALNINNNFYYVWDPTLNTRGAYVTVIVDSNTNTNPTSDANNYLQPNQAFFVQTKAAGAAGLTFKEEHKYTGSTATPNLYRTNNNQPAAAIAVGMYTNESLASNGPAADGFMVRFSDAYSNDVDELDALKPINQDENVGLINNGSSLSLESRALPQVGEVLALSNTTYRAAEYTYKVNVSNLEGVTAYLHDTFLGTETQLQNNAESLYSFSVIATDPASSAQDRFKIVFETETLSVGTPVAQVVGLYPNPSNGSSFNVLMPATENVTVNIYNQLGQKIAATATAQDAGFAIQPQTPLAAGIYMVEINDGQKAYTQKLIVKN